MKRVITLFLMLLIISAPVFAADLTINWTSSISTVDGYALFTRNYQQPAYGAAAWTGTALTNVLTVPSDRESAIIGRSFVWGPYDLNGVRTQVWSIDSNEVIFTPALPSAPATPLGVILAGTRISWNTVVGAGGYSVYVKDYQNPYNFSVPLATVTGLEYTLVPNATRQTAYVIRSFVYGPTLLNGSRATVYSASSAEVVYVPSVTPPQPPRSLLSTILNALLRFFGFSRG